MSSSKTPTRRASQSVGGTVGASLWIALVAGVSGCGGAPAGVASKDTVACATGPACESQVESEVAALEREIYAGFGALPPGESVGTTAGSEGAASPGPTQAAQPHPMAPVQEHHSADAAGDRCESACTALGSLGRAVDRLCGLTGAESPRCVDAQRRREAATTRVRANCSECGS